MADNKEKEKKERLRRKTSIKKQFYVFILIYDQNIFSMKIRKYKLGLSCAKLSSSWG
jgi:hypothetical protein